MEEGRKLITIVIDCFLPVCSLQVQTQAKLTRQRETTKFYNEREYCECNAMHSVVQCIWLASYSLCITHIHTREVQSSQSIERTVQIQWQRPGI